VEESKELQKVIIKIESHIQWGVKGIGLRLVEEIN